MNFWDNYHNVYDKFLHRSPTYDQILNDIIYILNLELKLKVLDAGCGTGHLSSRLLKSGCDIYSLDYSSNALNIFFKRKEGARIYEHDLRIKLPFNDDFFDRIVCVNVLYTFSRSQIISILDEFYRVLKSDGIIVITDPKADFSNIKIFISDLRMLLNTKGLFTMLLFLIKNSWNYVKLFFYNKKIDGNAKKSIYNFFSEDEYRQLLDSSRFNIISLKQTYAQQNLLLSAVKKTVAIG